MYRKKPPEESSKSKLLTLLLLVVVILSTVAVFLFNKNGFIAITEMQAEVSAIENTNNNLELEIESLTTVIYLLENDSLFIEKRVREILGWGRMNETVIKLMHSSTE